MASFSTARNAVTSLVIVLLTVSFPLAAWAEEAAPESGSQSQSQTASEPASTEESEKSQSASETGPQSPTGPDAGTYTKQDDGSWSNGTYTWNPETKQSSPTTPQDYSFNPQTKMWDTTEYVYSPETGKYVPNVKSVAAPPAGSPGIAVNGSTAGPVSDGNSTVANTGPGSTNQIISATDKNGLFNLFFNGAISNNISSNARSGDSIVQGNTVAGNALTGDASAVANVLNLLQSSWLGQSGDISTFLSNIDGTVYGDLLIDPNQLPAASGTNNSDLDVNVSNNGAINNKIDLAAQSGDAAVDGNTVGGNAQTGNARAMANVVNMINSAINAGKSFLGIVNINGNLDGDILLPKGTLENLIANTGPNSGNTIGTQNNSNLTVDTATNRSINNQVNVAADSGDANINNNTAAGSATSGNANTGVNTMNVVGQNVKGKNGLLVFLNVMGKWYGVVVGPQHSTINNTGPNSTNSVNGINNQSVSVAADENSQINNEINVNANSGDANVANNTKAGNARSGDASANVNLLNMIGSQIDVSDWFGVLFVNVFGNWNGNLGGDSAHGGFSQSGGGTTTQANTSGSGSGGGGGGGNQVFTFASKALNNFQTGAASVGDQPASPAESNENQNAAVFGSTTPDGESGNSSNSGASVQAPRLNTWMIAGIIGAILTAAILAREYILALRDERTV